MNAARKLFVMLLWILMLLPCEMIFAQIILHVAPDGNDAWSGNLQAPNANRTDGPFASLSGARDAIRKMKAAGQLKAPVRVLLHSGVYYLSETFTLEPQDSGTEQCPITYAAAPGAKPVVSGGRPIAGWHRHSETLWTTELPDVKAGKWNFRQLFVNGERRILARAPNEGYFRVAGNAPSLPDPITGKLTDVSKIAFRYAPTDIKPWLDLRRGNLMIFHNWKSGMLRIDRLDETTRTLFLTKPAQWPFQKRMRYIVENIFETLDAPGEWYLDDSTGILYYYPKPGEDMNTATIVAPVLEKIVEIAGKWEEGKYVEHIRFEGISFQHSNYVLEPEGHWPRQAETPTLPGAAIYARGARWCAIEKCEVAHVGNYAIMFHTGCSHNRIVQNHLHDLAAGGVRIGDYNIPKSDAEATSHNLISNNFIHDGCIMFHGAVGIWVGQSGHNVISHNEVCDLDYSGLSIGWTWGFGKSAAQRNIIEYNHIHHIGRGVLCDLGAIYTLGVSPGTKIHHNLIHHVWDWEEGYGASGIYLDEGSSEILVENNIVYYTTVGGFTLNYGRDNIVRNNIFAFGRDCQLGCGQGKKNGLCFTFERNIIYFKEGLAIRAPGEFNFKFDHNLYWHTAGKPLFLENFTFEQWQAKGLDQHSLVADPRFVNPEAGDFRLLPDSPAFKLGFQPIDISKAGLTGSPEWVNLPKQVKRPPTVIPRPFEFPPEFVDQDFEDVLVGARPLLGNVHEDGSGTVRVVDETAATGKHSLKITDAPDVKAVYDPRISYYPNVKEGIVRLSFDIRPEPGALISIAWRDRSTPFRIGPSLTIDALGNLKARDRKLLTLPLGQWTHMEIVCGLGTKATGSYELTVTLPNQPQQRFEKLPCDPKFTMLQWMGFNSDAREHTVFYLDNIKLEPLTERR